MGDNRYPDLQNLVRQYGGYWKIPTDEWIKYDAEVGAIWERLRRLHSPTGKFPGTRADYPTTTSRLWEPTA